MGKTKDNSPITPWENSWADLESKKTTVSKLPDWWGKPSILFETIPIPNSPLLRYDIEQKKFLPY